MDYGRQQDYLELTKALKNAGSRQEQEKLEKIMYRIVNESAPIKSLRDTLIKAMRAHDLPTVKRVQQHINKIRQDETYGREIS